MRILFIGTGDIGLPSLEWLLYTPKHQVVGVVTQPDKPAGRKLVLTPPQVKVRAEAAGIPVLQPKKIREAVDALKAFNADVAVVVAYGQILPRSVLDVPKLACLNIHASLLPKYRGASPIQAAIREGDALTGVTIMHMDEGLDTGDILLMDRVAIEPEDTGGTLHDKLALAAPASLEEALDLIDSGPVPRKQQEKEYASHCGKLKREDGHLDWTRSATELELLVRAYNPWPGTYALLPGADKPAPLKIHRARVIPNAEACPAPGTVVSSDPKTGLIIACGEGLLALEEVQAEGGKKMAAADLLRGRPIETGLVLA